MLVAFARVPTLSAYTVEWYSMRSAFNCRRFAIWVVAILTASTLVCSASPRVVSALMYVLPNTEIMILGTTAAMANAMKRRRKIGVLVIHFTFMSDRPLLDGTQLDATCSIGHLQEVPLPMKLETATKQAYNKIFPP